MKLRMLLAGMVVMSGLVVGTHAAGACPAGTTGLFNPLTGQKIVGCTGVTPSSHGFAGTCGGTCEWICVDAYFNGTGPTPIGFWENIPNMQFGGFCAP